jgi:hypothetical protein
MSSIKRDVKKKPLPRPEAEKILVSRSSPLTVSAPRLRSRGLALACLPFPWVSSSGGDHANRVLKLGKRTWSLRGNHGSIRGSWPHLSPDGVRQFYERAFEDCRLIYNRLPSPRKIQTLVQAWKQLWKWR